MVEQFRKKIERNEGISCNTSRKPFDVCKNLVNSREYKRQYTQNMEQMDKRLSKAEKYLQAFIQDLKADDKFGNYTSETLKDACKKMAQHARS